MKTRLILLSSALLLFLLLAPLALSQSSEYPAPAKDTFSVFVTPIQNQIIVNETASYEVTILNGYTSEKEFEIEKGGYPFWDMYTLPLVSPITVTVGPGSSETFIVYVRPLHITTVDTYTLPLGILDSQSQTKQTVILTVGIKSTAPLIGGYVPTVTTSVSFPQEIDPRTQATLAINLNNQNVLDYPNLIVRLSSALINKEFTYALGPKEEKRIEIPLALDPSTPPQKDRLVVSLFRDERTIINPIVRDYEVVEYLTKKESEPKSSFLKTTKTISLSSNNPTYQGSVREQTTRFSSLFTSTTPDATFIRENSNAYLVWDVELHQNELTITITKNYRPLVLIIIAIIATLTLYLLFRSPITVMKEVTNVSSKEGGISEMKVILRVKNRGKAQLTDIEVADIIPHIATVEKELSLGSLHPEKFAAHENGTVIKWKLAQLEPSEGIVLSYKMKSKLSILGEFSLPCATARVKHGNSYSISNSNKVTVSG